LPTIDDLQRFFNMYWDVRNVIIKFQMKSPKGKVYPSGSIEKIRNSLDDYVDGWLNNKPNKTANAEEHLSIAANETLEIILLSKIKRLDKIGKKLNRLFWRNFYPRTVFNYIYERQPIISEKMEDGKRHKASDYYIAKKAFEEGISIADEVINKYETWEIQGMRHAEQRLTLFWMAIITIFGTIVAMILVTIILKIDWLSLAGSVMNFFQNGF